MDQSKETVTVTESNFVIKEKGILKDYLLQVPNSTMHTSVSSHLTGLDKRRKEVQVFR